MELLTILGAKTSCKDRWRQVLSEGARVKEKHLITLQPSITASQLDEMRSHSLQLVVPQVFHSSYPVQASHLIWNLSTFIEFVTAKQIRGRS